MKREIFDLLDHYQDDSISFTDATPLSPARIEELTMKRLKQNHSARRPRRLTRGLLVAAVSTSLCCLTAFGVVLTLRGAARADMGISKEDPIEEWTEYDAPTQTGTWSEPQATLVATMCSGNQLYAYIAASPVSQ